MWLRKEKRMWKKREEEKEIEREGRRPGVGRKNNANVYHGGRSSEEERPAPGVPLRSTLRRHTPYIGYSTRRATIHWK